MSSQISLFYQLSFSPPDVHLPLLFLQMSFLFFSPFIFGPVDSKDASICCYGPFSADFPLIFSFILHFRKFSFQRNKFVQPYTLSLIMLLPPQNGLLLL
jgi:hypothetical protein